MSTLQCSCRDGQTIKNKTKMSLYKRPILVLKVLIEREAVTQYLCKKGGFSNVDFLAILRRPVLHSIFAESLAILIR